MVHLEAALSECPEFCQNAECRRCAVNLEPPDGSHSALGSQRHCKKLSQLFVLMRAGVRLIVTMPIFEAASCIPTSSSYVSTREKLALR